MARVLLIEDDEAQRFIARFALRKAGHDVHEAPDGPSGVAAARELRPDAVVCDVMMPGMSGYDVVAALRAEAALAATPVILLTAMSDRQHVRQGMTAGADDYLTKPYKPEELTEAVAAALKRLRAVQESIASAPGRDEGSFDDRKEHLAREYERRLVRELHGRWVDRADAAGDLHYPRAVVLLADLLGDAGHALPDSPDRAERLKQAQQAARDVLYLFGADHVLPYGHDYLGVFAGGDADATTPAEAQAVRAALALLRSGPAARDVVVGLYRGPVRLISAEDPLHNDKGHIVVPGETLAVGQVLRETAARNGWRVASTAELAAAAGQAASRGRFAAREAGTEAVELLPPQR